MPDGSFCYRAFIYNIQGRTSEFFIGVVKIWGGQIFVWGGEIQCDWTEEENKMPEKGIGGPGEESGRAKRIIFEVPGIGLWRGCSAEGVL